MSLPNGYVMIGWFRGPLGGRDEIDWISRNSAVPFQRLLPQRLLLGERIMRLDRVRVKVGQARLGPAPSPNGMAIRQERIVEAPRLAY